MLPPSWLCRTPCKRHINAFKVVELILILMVLLLSPIEKKNLPPSAAALAVSITKRKDDVYFCRIRHIAALFSVPFSDASPCSLQKH